MGVCPVGAHVRTTLGVSRKPDSSVKTRWAPSRAAFFYARPVFLLPAFDGFLVPFQSPPFRFLHAPSQAVQQAPDMIAMIFDSELTTDQFGNAGRGPQIGPPALRCGPLEKQADQTLSRRLIQFPGTARRKTHLESFPTAPAPGVPPAHYRNGGAAHTPSHFVQRITGVQQGQGTLAPVFEKIGAPLQSWHRRSGGNQSIYILHYLCRYQ